MTTCDMVIKAGPVCEACHGDRNIVMLIGRNHVRVKCPACCGRGRRLDELCGRRCRQSPYYRCRMGKTD